MAFLDGLAIDLIICTLKLQRVATLDSSYIQQLVGVGVFQDDENDVHTAWEAFQGPALAGCTVLQLRSLPIEGHGLALAHALASFIQDCQFKDVIILAGLDKKYRNDRQLNSSPIRYVAVDSVSEALATALKKSDLIPMEAITDSHDLYPVTMPPGAGITQFIYNDLANTGVSLLVLTMFVEPGDNCTTAQMLVDALDTLVPLKPASFKGWTIPISWASLYGTSDLGSFMEMF
ncbi:Proteasome assembly chaperone 2 [Kappamyces sp. JEL0680]|nr:Proteasome assembly chaperone 2 [Kappamyces sp. JEL0680]